jgi:hypothetical protein
VAIFGGVYFVVVTAAEVMGFGTSSSGLAAFAKSPSLLGDLGSSYVGSWVGNVITAGTTVSAFGCCLASTVAAARVVYAMSRDSFGSRHLGAANRWGTPAAATGLPARASPRRRRRAPWPRIHELAHRPRRRLGRQNQVRRAIYRDLERSTGRLPLFSCDGVWF